MAGLKGTLVMKHILRTVGCLLVGRPPIPRAAPWRRPRSGWGKSNVIHLFATRQQRGRGGPRQSLRFWAVPIAIVVGMPAVALVWDALGRPMPSVGHATDASEVRLIRGGMVTSETFDGRSAVIIDGDTIALGRERIRILNIDAPESHEPRCERELVAGLKAKERLAQLVRVEAVSVARDGKDRFGRTLATLSAGGKDVGVVLISEGLALPWRDGPEARAARIKHWCG